MEALYHCQLVGYKLLGRPTYTLTELVACLFSGAAITLAERARREIALYCIFDL